MKISDLIGNLVDIFGDPTTMPVQSHMNIKNRPNVQVENPELNDNADTTTMVGPLQQKLELLKKAVDVDNIYDEESAVQLPKESNAVNVTLNVPPGKSNTKIELTLNSPPGEIDELDRIKRIAGVPTASIFDAGDDEPLDS
mgnify:CR=1 FL=1|jgi:hypothetical protein